MALSVGVLVLVAPLGLLFVGPGSSQPDTDGTCSTGSDGSPTILGPATLTYDQLSGWWDTAGRGQPSRLVSPIELVIDLYLQEGAAEGIRGDVALAQAIHETGWFTSADTAISNFAGIGHPDGATTGLTFRDALTGVRAHIQLLKKFARGNDTTLAYPDVAPAAGATASTWAQLGGTWASDRDYWPKVAQIYTSMNPAGTSQGECAGTGVSNANGSLVDVHGITVRVSIASRLNAMLVEAQARGVTLTGTGYRSTERQVELRRAHCGTSNYAIYEAPANDCSPPTARPGESLHEQGLAVDFDDCSTTSTRCWQWLDQHAARFSFQPLAGEPWHWEVPSVS